MGISPNLPRPQWGAATRRCSDPARPLWGAATLACNEGVKAVAFTPSSDEKG